MPTPEEMLAGWPGFLAARAMPDAKLAVAIQRGQEVFVGTVSLNGLDISYKKGSEKLAWRPININMITMGDDFISIPLESYYKIEDRYYQCIPQYRTLELSGENNG